MRRREFITLIGGATAAWPPAMRAQDVVWFALNDDRPLFAFAGIWTEFDGMIRKVDGFPPQWEWRCGFYPGSAPGQYRFGTADQFDQVLIRRAPAYDGSMSAAATGFTTATTAEMAALQLSQTTVSA